MFSLSKPLNILLDRDNTLIKDYPYQSGDSKIEIIEPALLALQSISKFSNFFIITNQSGINRGYFSYQDYLVFTKSMLNMFAEHNIIFSGVYFCPHRPDESCYCRKPNPGLFERLKQEYNISNETTLMIGDKQSDIEFGINCKLSKSFLINTSSPELSWKNVLNYVHPLIK